MTFLSHRGCYVAAFTVALSTLALISIAPADEDVPFSFDFSFNAYPLAFHHQGPAITVYRLPDCDTSG